MGRPPKATNKTWKSVPSETPVCPDNLPVEAKEEWARVAPFLKSLGRIARIDKQSFVVYCIAWSQFCRIMRDEFSEPWAKLYADGPKCDVIHPAIPPLLRYAETIYRNAGQFGMTARTRDLEGDHGNRLSIHEKLLMGNRRKVAEHTLQNTVKPLLCEWNTGDVSCPDWVPSVAMTEYYELANTLTPADLFTPLDRSTLIVGCCLYELYMRSVSQMKDLYTEISRMEKIDDEWEEQTYQREHPLHMVQHQLSTFLHKVWKDYGMTARYRRIFNGENKRERVIPIEFKPKVVS